MWGIRMDIEEINLLKKFNPGDEYTERIKSAIEHLLAEREEDKKRIKELEEENRIFKDSNVLVNRYFKLKDNSIPVQKVKDLLTEIQEEYNEVQEQFDCIWNKKSKDDYDRYKLQEFSTMQQQLGFFIGKLEELLEEK